MATSQMGVRDSQKGFEGPKKGLGKSVGTLGDRVTSRLIILQHLPRIHVK